MHRARMRHLGLIALCGWMLAGCQTIPSKSQPLTATERAPVAVEAADQTVDAKPVASPQAEPVAAPPPTPAPAALALRPPDPWAVLSTRLTPRRCQQPRPAHFIGRYASHPERFQARLTHYAPILHYVASELLARQLPAEIALVPIVESTYQGYPGRGQRPAGMWQMIPSTARSLGLVVREGNDQRLETARSTDAALTLFERLLARFDQQLPLAIAAYNAGDGRVSRALASHPGRSVRELPLSKITIDYLDKIEALSCLIANPGAYGFSMPPLPEAAQLTTVELAYSADAAKLAKAIRVDPQLLRRYNGAIRGPQSRPPGHRWMIPKGSAELILAVQSTQVAPTLAASGAADLGEGVHVVQAGDNLWSLARRYGLSVRELRLWNGLNNKSLLRIGQRLKLMP